MNLPNTSARYLDENGTGIQQETPGMSFRCRDIGMNCPFEAQGSTGRELMRKFIDHAGPVHRMPVLSAEVIFKVQNAIKK